jgi:hypothetical protein
MFLRDGIRAIRSGSRELEEGNGICVYAEVSIYNSAQLETVLVFNVHDRRRCARLTCVQKYAYSHFTPGSAFLGLCNMTWYLGYQEPHFYRGS